MKRALLVGINEYDNLPPLTGCVNDVRALAPLFSRNEDDSPNFEVITRTTDSERIGRASLLADVNNLFGPGAEVAVLYFAGHGEADNSDVTICTQDGTHGDTGIPFAQILSIIQRSSVAEIVVILDCCYSGGAGGSGVIGGNLALLRSGVAILSASRNDQPAAEAVGGQGLFSFYLAGALDGGASDVLGAVTVAGAYAYLSESLGAWNQRPTFKSNLEKLQLLRRCAPTPPLRDLRRLPTIFSTADHLFALDPSYEPEAEPDHPEHEEIFAVLQRYRAAKLVEPVGSDHMYFAAMDSKHCRLTPMGRHYWHLASRGWI